MARSPCPLHSTAAPAGFSLVNVPDEDAANAIAAVSTVGYTGFIWSPPILGWVADTFSLRASVSVIIPAYNAATTIGETLASVLAQSVPPAEVLVMDDGSTDNTAEVIQQLNQEKIKYFHKANEERSIARNYGADKASGDYLIFLDYVM